MITLNLLRTHTLEEPKHTSRDPESAQETRKQHLSEWFSPAPTQAVPVYSVHQGGSAYCSREHARVGRSSLSSWSEFIYSLKYTLKEGGKDSDSIQLEGSSLL